MRLPHHRFALPRNDITRGVAKQTKHDLDSLIEGGNGFAAYLKSINL